MTNLSSRDRAFGAAGAVVLLLLLALLVRTFAAARPTQIADFSIPALRGWKRETKKTASSRFVSFTKDVGADRLFIKLTWHQKESLNPPKTIADLQKLDADNQLQMAAVLGQLASQFGVGAPVIQRISTQPTTLNTMPALLIKDFSPGRQPTQMQLLLFTNGRNYYDLLANHSVPQGETPSPEAQAQLDAAWQTLSAAFRP